MRFKPEIERLKKEKIFKLLLLRQENLYYSSGILFLN